MIRVLGWEIYSPREVREAREADVRLAGAVRDLSGAVERSRVRRGRRARVAAKVEQTKEKA
jgi:hypothetical protein